MTDSNGGWGIWLRRAMLALAALFAIGPGSAAQAAHWPLPHSLCHATSATVQPPRAAPRSPYSCNGTATGYQRGTLWLRVDLDTIPIPRNDLVLSIHNTRFDALSVGFVYADGVSAWQGVHGGDFGTHWRPGAQIAFAAPDREAPLRTIVLQFDRLTSYDLLRMRLATQGDGALEVVALAACVGAALMLLFIAALYNISLSFAVRRQFPAWQAAWAGCMVIWGAVWSQLNLFVLPGMAGSFSAQLCTGLSCLAVMLATFGAITALDRRELPVALRIATLALGIGIGALGVPLSFMRTGPLEFWASVLGMMVLADLTAITLSLTIAWRRGNALARDFAAAWAVPMITLGVTQFLPTDRLFWGGGSQMLVLLAATWQTIWVSVSATRRLRRLRVERDHALRAEAIAHDLARRDPLTGLRNRRGFTEAVEPMIACAVAGESPFALLLIDVDRFKVVNDTHGHDAGDQVLCIIARELERWEGALCLPARFGGEEFAMALSGLHTFAATQFAERLREDIAAADYAAVIGGGDITVSIGIATATEDADFQSLYRQADRSLYEAKRRGRDCVVASDPQPDGDLAVGMVA